MKSYGIPQRIIDIIRNFYDGSGCAVRHEERWGNGFQIITFTSAAGMCLVTVDLCPAVVDWVMTRVMSGKDTGIRCVNGDRLGDLDFADEISPCWKIPGRA